ncbi:MAG: carbohydrate ABC transporter permease [Roseburia sp.]|nr:carbohydrate ABC transporter permease [Roseburia sp.]MCM1098978.1 carbohydrate ABC transporter permease [Ruminococcus flavefaciens]
MVEKKSVSRVIFNIINYGFLIFFSIICIIPVWHVVMASISDPRLLMGSSGVLLKPLGDITLEGYKLVLNNKSIMTGYANTILYVFVTTVIMAVGTLIGGFLLSRKNFKLKGPLSVMIMFTMMFYGGLIPSYMVVRNLGMLNTRLAVIIPGVLNAFYIMMMKSSFEQLPDSYEESAKLDGAGPLVTLFRILAPLLKATIAVVIMFNVIMQWNSWYSASIYLVKARNYWPLQLFMREILIQNDASKVATNISGEDAKQAADFVGNLVKYCVTVVGTMPLLCAYPFAQKYFVTGVQMGGVKG